jgi:hypothetical protein
MCQPTGFLSNFLKLALTPFSDNVTQRPSSPVYP